MKLLAKIFVGSVLFGGGAALYADPNGGWLSPNGTGGGSATAAVSGTLTVEDALTRSHLLHEQIRGDARHMQHLQQVARREKDIIKLNCVNDKLVQVKPEMNIADSSESALEGARDAERLAIFEDMSRSAETVRRLREEADQCIGEPIVGSESSNSFTGPQAPDDPTKGGFGNGNIEPPGYASPYN